jgi:hypothetical protein
LRYALSREGTKVRINAVSPASTLSVAKFMPWSGDRHRSREFIEFLKLLDATYPAHTAIKLILDNHSGHISKETRAWIARQPAQRFEFTFTPRMAPGST